MAYYQYCLSLPIKCTLILLKIREFYEAESMMNQNTGYPKKIAPFSKKNYSCSHYLCENDFYNKSEITSCFFFCFFKHTLQRLNMSTLLGATAAYLLDICLIFQFLPVLYPLPSPNMTGDQCFCLCTDSLSPGIAYTIA